MSASTRLKRKSDPDELAPKKTPATLPFVACALISGAGMAAAVAEAIGVLDPSPLPEGFESAGRSVTRSHLFNMGVSLLIAGIPVFWWAPRLRSWHAAVRYRWLRIGFLLGIGAGFYPLVLAVAIQFWNALHPLGST